jgi:hypothetical protein
MEEEIVTDASLRQFLLGSVDDEERQRIESLVITNAVSKERVCAVEEVLLEDYLEDVLSASDRKRFLAQYAYSRELRRRLRITRDIKNWAIALQEKNTTSAAQTSRWSDLFVWFRLKKMLVMPIAAVTLIVLVAVGLWLSRKIALRNHQLAVEQEIVPDVQASSLTLRAGSLRSAEMQSDLVIRPDTQIVELRLLWNQSDSYPTYQGVLNRIGDVQSFNIRDLRPDSEGKAFRLRLPAHILTIGTYRLQLIGVAADGHLSPLEEFQFSVSY